MEPQGDGDDVYYARRLNGLKGTPDDVSRRHGSHRGDRRPCGPARTRDIQIGLVGSEKADSFVVAVPRFFEARGDWAAHCGGRDDGGGDGGGARGDGFRCLWGCLGGRGGGRFLAPRYRLPLFMDRIFAGGLYVLCLPFFQRTRCASRYERRGLSSTWS